MEYELKLHTVAVCVHGCVDVFLYVRCAYVYKAWVCECVYSCVLLMKVHVCMCHYVASYPTRILP